MDIEVSYDGRKSLRGGSENARSYANTEIQPHKCDAVYGCQNLVQRELH